MSVIFVIGSAVCLLFVFTLFIFVVVVFFSFHLVT